MVKSGGKWWNGVDGGGMFYGEFEYKIDEKGRIPLPPKFRDELKAGVVLFPGIEKCINLYPISEWKKLASTLTSTSIAASKMRRLYRAIFSTAFQLSLDKQGRIAIPTPLREHAEIGDEVIIAGANNYLEIWDKARWEPEKATSLEQAGQIIESLENR